MHYNLALLTREKVCEDDIYKILENYDENKGEGIDKFISFDYLQKVYGAFIKDIKPTKLKNIIHSCYALYDDTTSFMLGRELWRREYEEPVVLKGFGSNALGLCGDGSLYLTILDCHQ